MHQIDRDDAEGFITKWSGVNASELSTSQSFLADLCRLLGVPGPHPTPEQDYMFERPITFVHGDGSTSAGRIDLYRRGAFVLESKKLRVGPKGKGFDEALLRARSQAEGYARALPAAEGRPPFVVVVDVGNRIELYAEFSRSGATYTPFPDPRSHRIALADLRDAAVRERLRQVWLDPMALDPSRESARAASSSRAIWAASSGRVSGCLNSLPLKRSTSSTSTAEKPPLSMSRHSWATMRMAVSGCSRWRVNRVRKLSCGSSFTSSANMVNRQRIRNCATACASWPLFSSDLASSASCAAIWRVTRADSRLGSSAIGSSQTWRRRSRTAASRRSARAMRWLRGSGKGV